MLEINTEFRKGILFTRLSGILSDDTNDKFQKFLETMIGRDNIKYIVFNIKDLKYIDLDGIKTLLNYNQILNNKGGKAVICGIENELTKIRIYNSHMLNYMFEASDELGAINYLSL